MESAYLVLFPAILGALLVTGIFLWGLWKVLTSEPVREGVRKIAEALGLIRSEENPILTPGPYPWEQTAVMNPGVVEAGDRVHLFYRALGSDGVSRIGYASSPDGVHFDDRLPYPVFSLDGADPHALPSRAYMEMMYPQLVASGGSWGGVEDPRAVVIDGRLYLSFSAFYNWSSLRIGVVSMSVDDLLNKKWKWSRPVFLSPENQVQKNWVLFPEKIHGQFAVLHSLHSGSRDKVLIDYVDSLDHPPQPIESPYYPVEDDTVWDSRLRGAGPPPLKTDAGWLVLYHANDAREPHKYKLGALLLDLKDPSNIIARSSAPVLTPDAGYENNGKPGIVYACGAVLKDRMLRVYYGGADAVVCTAVAPLAKLLRELRVPRLTAV